MDVLNLKMAPFWKLLCCTNDQEEEETRNDLPPFLSQPVPQNSSVLPEYTTGFENDEFITVSPPDLPPPLYTRFDPHPPGCNCAIHINRVSRPTIIELFQSQGCNSCPPTSSNLKSILANSDDPNLLVLDYHVTYWDHLGWKDVFGNDEFSQRQRDYTRRRGDNRVYTPQVIVNGISEGVGQTDSELKEIIKKGQKARKGEKWAQLELAGERKLKVTGASDMKGIVTIVTYDPRLLSVDINKGENMGKRLLFTHTVRNIEQIEDWTGGEQLFELPSRGDIHERWQQAVLVQQGRGGPIIGAARV
jgi:hypothetical protein